MACTGCSPKGFVSAKSFNTFSFQQKLRRFFAFSGLVLAVVVMTIAPRHANAQRPLGIDVSSYQGNSVNWTSVKGAGYTFAWAKATEGEYDQDADFVINENGAKSVGVYMGPYDFCRPDLYTPSSEEAYFWGYAGQFIKADGLTLMPMLDFETFNGYTGSTSYANWANLWCQADTNHAALNGVYIKPFIYISACKAGNLDSTVSIWGSDIANYGSVNGGNNPQTGTPWSSCSADDVWGGTSWNMWQYESVGSVPGISGNCDMDVYNGSSAGLFNQWVAYGIAGGGIFYYWDPQGTTGGNPYTGNMSAIWEGANWATVNTGQTSPTNWIDGKCCVIGVNTASNTPAFTITMTNSHTVAGFFNGGYSGTKGGNVTITGGGIISMAAGAQGIDNPNSYDQLNFSNVIAGTGQVVPEGSGSLYLNAANTYSGGTQLGYSGNPFSGTLYFNNGSAFGSGLITLSSVGNLSALVLQGSSAATVPNSITVSSATTNNIAGNTAGLTFSGPWTLSANVSIGSGGVAANLVTISGAISGAGTLTKYNPGILALSGVNTYTGATTVSAGTLNITGAGKLGNGSYSAAITDNAKLIYSSTAAQTFSGVLSGTGSLTVSNGGALTLSGTANTYSGGTTVSYGSTVSIASDASLGASTAGITINGGCLKNNNSAPTLGSGRTITLGAFGGYFDAGWAPSNPITINGKLTGSGALLIDTDGSPVVLANTTNNYTGDTIVGTNGPGYYASGSQAWLKMGASNVLPNGSGKGNVTIFAAYKGLLDLAGTSQTINGLNGDGTINNSTGTGFLSVGNNNANSIFNGLIENTNGTLSLTKIGTGTLTLNGTNTYSGRTLISAGTLALGGTGSVNNTSSINIAAGATLDVSAIGAFTLGGPPSLSASGNVTPATIIGGTTVNLGSQAIFLTYDGSHPALTIAQGQLVLNGNTFNITGSALPPGVYTIVQQASGSISASGSFAVSGSAIGAGTVGGIAISGGNVDLIVKAVPAFSNLTANPTVVYGTPNIALSGTVSGNGPTYPASGETVTVTINGHAQNTTINDSTGDFSLNYNLAGIPVSGTAYTITYAYSGNATLTAASDASKTITINPLAAVLTGSRSADGTATVSASVLSVSNKVGGDLVTVASGSGTLAGTNYGVQPIVSLGNLALGGEAAGNYTLTGATGSVRITGPLISSATVDSTGTNLVITWYSVPGTTYQVIGSPNVTTSLSTWTNVGAAITATGTVTSATNAITPTGSMYFDVKGQ